MSFINEICAMPRIWANDFHEWRRKKAPEPRLWVRRWNDGRYSLEEVTCPPDIAKVMVFLNMNPSQKPSSPALSNAEAGRLIKAGAVEWRDAFCFDEWWKVVQLRQKLPVGEPILLRVGKKTYDTQIVMVPHKLNQLNWWEKEICQ